MANYVDDFDGYPVASGLPSGWTNRWNVPSPGYSIYDDTAGGRSLRNQPASSGRYFASLDSVDGDADRANTEALVVVRTDARTASVTHEGVILRGAGTGQTNEIGYVVGFFGRELRIGRYNLGFTQLAITSGFNAADSLRYRIRARINGTSLQAKAWLDGDAEPGSWTLTVTDTVLSAAGWTGFFTFSAPQMDCSRIAVATNGDTATFSAGGGGNASGSIASIALGAPDASGSGGASASGTVDAIDLAAAEASASGGAGAAGVVDAIDLAAPQATALVGSGAAAAGGLSSIALVAPGAAGSGGAAAAGAVDNIDLTAPQATASGGGSGTATGDLASVALSAPAAAGSGGAAAAGAVDNIDLVAPDATATGGSGGEGFASGDMPVLGIDAPAASGSGGAAAQGQFAGVDVAPPQGSASTQLPTVARPVADISQGTWLPSVGTDLYAMVDESEAGGLDYIFATTVGAKCEMALNETEFPGGASQRFYYEAESSTNTSVIVSLKQGSTVIASWVQALTPATTVYSRDLSPAEIALIGPGAVSVELEVSA